MTAADSDTRTAAQVTGRLGRGVSLAVLVVGAVAAAVSVTTPPRSGPFCRSACLTFPYLGADAFVPRDYWWMYPQSLLVLLGLVLLVCVRHALPSDVGVLGAVGVALWGVGTAVLLADYAVQLAVVQPSLLRGGGVQVAPLTQYDPAGVFIGLEDVGYLLLGLALVPVAAAFRGRRHRERALRWLLAAAGGTTVALLPVLAVAYGADLAYRYEVAAIALVWVGLLTGAVLLLGWFGRPAVAGPSPGDAGRGLGPQRDRPPQPGAALGTRVQGEVAPELGGP